MADALRCARRVMVKAKVNNGVRAWRASYRRGRHQKAKSGGGTLLLLPFVLPAFSHLFSRQATAAPASRSPSPSLYLPTAYPLHLFCLLHAALHCTASLSAAFHTCLHAALFLQHIFSAALSSFAFACLPHLFPPRTASFHFHTACAVCVCGVCDSGNEAVKGDSGTCWLLLSALRASSSFPFLFPHVYLILILPATTWRWPACAGSMHTSWPALPPISSLPAARTSFTLLLPPAACLLLK